MYIVAVVILACDRRRGGDWNRGDDYNRGNYYRGEGDRRDWGRRKLQQGVVGQIVCDALGNCDDGRSGHAQSKVPGPVMAQAVFSHLSLCSRTVLLRVVSLQILENVRLVLMSKASEGVCVVWQG